MEAQNILVVVSKVKKLIKDRSGMNTSQETIEALTKVIEDRVDQAIKSATDDGRKTVMARDFKQQPTQLS